MPDWTYRTIVRPLLFRLPVAVGRDLATGMIGSIARLPWGRHVIEFMGHMRPPAPLRRRLGTAELDAPLGLAPGIDPSLVGLPGVARFGFGFVEVGPVTVAPRRERRTSRDDDTEAITLEPADMNPGLEACGTALGRLRPPRPLIVVRLAADAAADADQAVIGRLTDHATAFSVPLPAAAGGASDGGWLDRLGRIERLAAGRPLLVVVPVNAAPDAIGLVAAARAAGAAGAIVGRAEFADRAQMGAAWLDAAAAWTRRLRALFDAEGCVIGAAGIHAPGDAERLVEAGADLVAVDSGLVFTGPGLAKRCNELLLLRNVSAAAPADPLRERWPWAFVIGTSMVVGGLMALAIACTRVVMPYDEAMSGPDRCRQPEAASFHGPRPRLARRGDARRRHPVRGAGLVRDPPRAALGRAGGDRAGAGRFPLLLLLSGVRLLRSAARLRDGDPVPVHAPRHRRPSQPARGRRRCRSRQRRRLAARPVGAARVRGSRLAGARGRDRDLDHRHDDGLRS
jgi:hypothetical protein